jgi:hypothetical protein
MALPFRFPNHNVVLISHLFGLATYTAHLFLLDLITLIVFGEEYKL